TRTLEDMELVEETGKDAAPGGPALYVTTNRLLELLGIGSLDALPPLEDLAPDAETVERIKRSLSGSAGEAAGTPWEPLAADESGEAPAPE
ncbi:MAG: SMC-Scp complex subunit ScpB, partial [Candidatus Geothermincolia bacterium]